MKINNSQRIFNTIKVTELVKVLISIVDRQEKQIQTLDLEVEKLIKNGDNYVK